jgi:hypothetical protein
MEGGRKMSVTLPERKPHPLSPNANLQGLQDWLKKWYVFRSGCRLKGERKDTELQMMLPFRLLQGVGQRIKVKRVEEMIVMTKLNDGFIVSIQISDLPVHATSACSRLIR